MTHHQLLRSFIGTFLGAPSGHAPLPWVHWKRLSLPVATSIAVMGCGGDATSDARGEGACTSGACGEECSDQADNDRDGSIDCGDPSCATSPFCAQHGTGGLGGTGGTISMGGAAYGIPYEYCDDDTDNDANGLVDCADPSCAGSLLCPASGGAGGVGGVNTGGVGGCAGGSHDCDGACVSSSSPAHCGTACEPCPADPNAIGTPTCVEGDHCGLDCGTYALPCGDACCYNYP